MQEATFKFQRAEIPLIVKISLVKSRFACQILVCALPPGAARIMMNP
jgi:hypothetical protein